MNGKNHGPILGLRDGISVIVITGGPCSGKTTGLSCLSRMLADRGYKVLVVPESATKLIGAGMLPGELQGIGFQEEILLDTLAQEERLHSIAARYRNLGRKVVVLCDRGAMDGEAYVNPAEFTKMIRRLGYTDRNLCDERYHAVMHMRTAALGAEKFYTLANNQARTETPEVARALDERTLQAWARHQHPRVVSNDTDFDGKIRRLFAEVCAVLGDPIPLEKEDKFLLRSFDPAGVPVAMHESLITQDYLVSSVTGEERRVRARGEHGNVSYYYTIKRDVSPGVRVEEEKMISWREYDVLLTLRDPKKDTIQKRRTCFFWEEQFFEVDIFEGHATGLILLEAERTDRTPTLKLPPFLNVVRNVTGEKPYSNSGIAEGLVRRE